MRIRSHRAEAKPVSNLRIDRDIDALCDDVHSVAGHAEERGVSGLEDCGDFFLRVDF